MRGRLRHQVGSIFSTLWLVEILTIAILINHVILSIFIVTALETSAFIIIIHFRSQLRFLFNEMKSHGLKEFVMPPPGRALERYLRWRDAHPKAKAAGD